MPEIPVADPSVIEVQVGVDDGWVPPSSVSVVCTRAGNGLKVDIGALDDVARVRLTWRVDVPSSGLVLGDAWERSYGDLRWAHMDGSRTLPWTALVHDTDVGATWGFGVEVRGGAFAGWTVSERQVSLVLDLRCGGASVRPGDRAIHAGTIRWSEASGLSAFAAQCELMGLLCRDPLMPEHPVVGANNWYYAYGKGLDVETVLRDAWLISQYAGPGPRRPYAVLDDGWSPSGVADGFAASGGPWDAGRDPEFTRLAELPGAVCAEGARPGIWFRPLLTRSRSDPAARWERDGRTALDPTAPGMDERISEDFARLVGWGFEMIKHDFSTVDLVGRWGFEMGDSPSGGPPLRRRDLTTAEALVNFYRTIRSASGSALLIGCNTVGHLAAGLTHVSRTGDDVSGSDWSRTRRMGVNTLAFRLAQHGRFHAVDADCIPCTPQVPWELNRRFLGLVARSRTALFVSVDPAARTDRADQDIATAVQRVLHGPTASDLEPLDWLSSSTPSSWADDEGEHQYSWDA